MKKFKWILLIWLASLAIVLGAICFILVVLIAIGAMVGIHKEVIEITLTYKLVLFAFIVFFLWASLELTFGGKELLEKAKKHFALCSRL